MVNITEIGITAGDIWQYLDRNDSATLADLQKELEKSQELILLSLGWLAREGHITLEDATSDFKAALTQK